jgi:hypothetical protein
MPNSRDYCARMHLKVQKILTNMGGFIKGIIVILEVLFFLFQITNYNFFLIENHYVSNGSGIIDREAACAI